MTGGTQGFMQVLTGFWAFQTIYVAVKLGIADHLEDGPLDLTLLSAKSQVDPDRLYRVLRALASMGVFEERAEKTFALTPVSDVLRAGHPESMQAVVLMLGEQNYPAWGQLYDGVKGGGTPFELAFGLPAYEYFEQNARANEIFNTAMAALVRHDQAAVAEAYDFSRFQCVVDVGGGTGMLLAAILKRHPNLQGILFDLPQVIQGAALEGVQDRCKLVSGDFFRAVAEGGDAYLLSHIIHTFSDELCLQILRNVHRAMPADGTLLIVEDILDPAGGPETVKTKLMDLNMLVLTPGGREHTRREFEELLAQSGFRMTGTTPTPGGTTVIEAQKA